MFFGEDFSERNSCDSHSDLPPLHSYAKVDLKHISYENININDFSYLL